MIRIAINLFDAQESRKHRKNGQNGQQFTSRLFFRGLNGLENLFSDNSLVFEASWIFMLSSLNNWHPDSNTFLAKMVGSIFAVHIIVLAWLDVDGVSDVELPSPLSIIPSHGWPTFQFGLNACFCLLISYNRCIFSFSSEVFIFLLGGGDTPAK